MGWFARFREYWQLAGAAAVQVGVSRWRIIRDLLEQRFGPGEESLSEYFDHRAFDSIRQPRSQRIPYGGRQRCLKDDRILNSDDWRATANDKLLTYALLRSNGFACADVRLIYSTQNRGFGSTPVVGNIEELFEKLDGMLAEGPLFMKPISAGYGRGAALVVACRADRSGLELGNGKILERELLERLLEFRPFSGFIFQQPILQHSEVERRVGKSVSSIRFRMVRTANGLVCFGSHWKIAAGGSMIDNLGATGFRALLGHVDLRTGRVGPVWNGKGLTGRKILTHPDTGERIDGFTIPHWEAAKHYVLSAFRVFEGLWLQHWDIAISSDGPVAVELNTESAIGYTQLAAENGAYIPEIAQAIRDHNQWQEQFEANARCLKSYDKDFLLT